MRVNKIPRLFVIPNKKGQVFFFTLMLAAVVVILILALTPALRESSRNTRNTTIGDYDSAPGLDCDNSSISDFNKGACITTDLTMPYFLGIGLAIAGILIGARIIFG